MTWSAAMAGEPGIGAFPHYVSNSRLAGSNKREDTENEVPGRPTTITNRCCYRLKVTINK